MYKFLCLFISGISVLPLYAQRLPADSSLKYVTLHEFVISANRFSSLKQNVAQKIEIISPAYIASVNAQNTGDLLMSTGNVFVQKSQQGGSSPVIRGFEASRVLLVIDGVRMNNAIYRAGHLQNVITVDQNMLERTEVMYGPSSTLYGSDALGGVINFRTKRPTLATDGKSNQIEGSVFTRYSSANHEKTAHGHVSIGFKKWGFLTSVTYSDFDDLKMGRRYYGKFAGFGKRTHYIDQFQGVDSVFTNADDRVQKFSGYTQYDLTQKFLFKPNDQFTHTLNIQFSNSSDIPRYDRLQDVRNGTLRYAKWYYGPQKRNLFAYEFNAEKIKGLFEQVRMNINLQDIRESRNTREYRQYDRLDSRIEKIKVWGFIIDARKSWADNELTMGIDGQLNDLTSIGIRKNILTGEQSKIDSRYPDGDNNMNNFALFAQHSKKFAEGKFVINEGLRLQTSFLHSTLVDTAVQLHLPYFEIKQNNIAVTGNLGFVFNGPNNFRISSVFSSGFRAPNIDDLSRIFESSTASRQVIVPNPHIKPEYTYNVDLSVSKIFMQQVKFEVTGFHTWFINAIALSGFNFHGSDSILYQGRLSQVLANQNVNRAYLYGVTGSFAADLTRRFSLSATLNITEGRYLTDTSKLTKMYEKQPDNSYQIVQRQVSSKPMDHIPPAFGKLSLMYRLERFNVEAYMMYNSWKRLDDYNAEGEDNGQYATPEGTPAWSTFNVRSALKINKILMLQAAIENITDRNYRYFASGLSAPGRNYVLTLRAAF